jgi:hypothetical protein
MNNVTVQNNVTLRCGTEYTNTIYKNRIAKNNKVLSTISSTIIVFVIRPLLMYQDFETKLD